MSFVVAYTDPAWAQTLEGDIDHTRATIEREVLGELATIRIGSTTNRDPGGESALAELVKDSDAIVIYRVTVDDHLLENAGSRLKAVARQGVGTDNLNAPLLRSKGIIGFNVPDYCVDEVATHTVAFVLAAERHIIPQHTALANGRFDIYHGGMPRRLNGCTAGIVGFGRIGRVVGARLKQFYGSVIACDPDVTADQMAAYGVERVSFEALLKRSDVVSLHCPLDETTSGMMGENAFSLMKTGSVFVNAARGGLVEAKALWQALHDNRISAAALDVFVPEDPTNCPYYKKILQRPNVVVTSHRAFLSAQAEDSQRRRVAENIRDVLLTGSRPRIGCLA